MAYNASYRAEAMSYVLIIGKLKVINCGSVHTRQVKITRPI